MAGLTGRVTSVAVGLRGVPSCMGEIMFVPPLIVLIVLESLPRRDNIPPKGEPLI